MTSIAENPRSHAQVTPFYQVRTTQEPVYQAQGEFGSLGLVPEERDGTPSLAAAATDKYGQIPMMQQWTNRLIDSFTAIMGNYR